MNNTWLSVFTSCTQDNFITFYSRYNALINGYSNNKSLSQKFNCEKLEVNNIGRRALDLTEREIF